MKQQNIKQLELLREKDQTVLYIRNGMVSKDSINASLMKYISDDETFLFKTAKATYQLKIHQFRHIDKTEFHATFKPIDTNLDVLQILQENPPIPLSYIETRNLKEFTLWQKEEKEIISTKRCHFNIHPRKISFWGLYYFSVGEEFTLKTALQTVTLKVTKRQQCSQNEFDTDLTLLDKNVNLVHLIQEEYQVDYRSQEDIDKAKLAEPTTQQNVQEQLEILLNRKTGEDNQQAMHIMMNILGYSFKKAFLSLKFDYAVYHRTLKVADLTIYYSMNKRIAPALDYPYLEVSREVRKGERSIEGFYKSWSQNEDFSEAGVLITKDLSRLSSRIEKLLTFEV